MNKVLIIEGDFNIIRLLEIHLRDLNCEVVYATNGRDGLSMAMQQSFDLVILDIVIPVINGMEVCRRIRQQGQTTPILILSAKSEEIDKVMGLESGADDYMTKPFGIREFIARVNVIFRRKENALTHPQENTDPSIQLGDLEIDIEMRKVSLRGTRVDLSPKEFELLTLLATRPGKSYSRKRLLNLVWGYEFEGYEHTVNSHINRLRGKIESDISKPRYILTTWGIGYRFNEEI
jgi:two-component system alkaline phosphatase synthesis response regulator PhoP